jgi:hypothetical protein
MPESGRNGSDGKRRGIRGKDGPGIDNSFKRAEQRPFFS